MARARLGDELLAKDKRRQSKRRGITAGAMVLGGLAIVGIGYIVYRKLFYDAQTPGRTDWSGCFSPPDWVQPRPQFSCATKVADSLHNEEGYITARTWSNGQWLYSFTGSDNIHEEANLG